MNSADLEGGVASVDDVGRRQVRVEHHLAVADLHRDVGLVQVLVQLPGQDPGDDVAVLWTAEHLKSSGQLSSINFLYRLMVA